GLSRLMLLQSTQPVKYLQKELLKNKELALSVASIGSKDQVIDDILMTTFCQLCAPDQTDLPRTRAEFDARLAAAKDKIILHAQELAAVLITSLTLLIEVRNQIKQHKNKLPLAFCLGDIQQQLQQLFYPGFLY